MKKVLSILSLLLCLAASAAPCRFYPSKDNLSSSLVNGIFCDSRGNIWIPTEFGLNRYDGNSFTSFTHDPSDHSSLASNFVSSVCEDSEGHVFVCSHGGIQLFDEGSRSFSPLARRTDGSVFGENMLTVLQRSNGELLAVGASLVRLQIREDGRLLVQNVEAGLPQGFIRDICEDSWGSLWLLIGGQKIVQMRPDGSLEEFDLGPGHNVSDIYEDPQSHELLVADSSTGVYRFDQMNGGFVPVPYDKGILPALRFCRYQDQVLIGTEGAGVKCLKDGEISEYRLDGGTDYSGSRVHGFAIDQGGNLWMGLYQNGLLMQPALQENFNYIGHNSVYEDKIGSASISAICRKRDGTLWIATTSGDIYGLGRDNEVIKHWRTGSAENGLSWTALSFFEDSSGRFWVGSSNSEVLWLDTSTGRFTQVLSPDGGLSSTGAVVDFSQDGEGRIWIASDGAGLLYYEPSTGELHNAGARIPGFPSHITSIKATHDGKLCAGSYLGSFYLDLQDAMRMVMISSDDKVHDIVEASDGRIWFACDGGVTVWTPRSGSMLKYGNADGLSGNVVYSILEDRGGGLWMGTDKGLSYYNISRNRYFNYTEEDGIQGNEFCRGAGWEDADGTLWFGGLEGVTWFDPRRITSPIKKWNLKITDIYLHGAPITTATLSGGKPVLEVPVSECSNINLKYTDNAFTILFSPVNYDYPGRLEYFYSMDGSPWQHTQVSNRMSFSSLPAGKHRFALKAVDSGMESDELVLSVNIRPAWWNTALARILGVLLLLSLVAVTWWLRRRNRASYRRMREIEQDRRIRDSKIDIFTKMAHELRSPLSLIISPLHRLMGNDPDPSRQKSYRTMERNSQRIALLVNQLLEMQKLDDGKLEMRFSKTDLIPYIGKVVDNFRDEFALREISLNYNHPGVDSLLVSIDPEQFDKVVFNLLSNSLKFTPNEGEVTVDVASVDGMAEISVTDTGIGVEPSERDKIFGQFYQGENSRATWDSGTGIGLHLSRMLVEMHGGSISVTNNDGAPHGSRFIVRIPLEREPDAAQAVPAVDDLDSPARQPVSAEGRPAILSGARDLTPDAPREKVVSRSKHVIFVVDDDPEVGEYLVEEFARDYHVKVFGNGKDALEAALRKAPDLMVSDVMMPVMDGLTLCRKVRQNPNLNHIPFVLLTAKTGVENNIEGLNTGADAYIPKPFDIGVLRSTVENLLGSRRMLKNKFEGRQNRQEELSGISIKTPDDKLMGRIMRILNDNLANPELTVDFLSREVGISRSHIYRKLRELTNQSPQDFIRNTRLAMAAKLLKEGNQSIAEVAEKVGFGNPDNFATAFKKLYGKTPREYMKSGD